MTIWDKLTGNDLSRELKGYEERAKKLPADYQVAWGAVKAELWQHADFSGRNVLPILEGVLELFEESNVDGLMAESVLGEDIIGFCKALVGNDSANTFRDKWRKQLNESVAQKLGR